jgi:hypothetical protein
MLQDFAQWINLPLQIGFGILVGHICVKIWTRLVG